MGSFAFMTDKDEQIIDNWNSTPEELDPIYDRICVPFFVGLVEMSGLKIKTALDTPVSSSQAKEVFLRLCNMNQTLGEEYI